MYFDVPFILVIVLMTSNYMDSAPTPQGEYFDAEWDELFGHLTKESTISRKPDKFFLGKHGQPKPSGRPLGAPLLKPLVLDIDGSESPTRDSEPLIVDSDNSERPVVPPAPPAAPFVYDPNKIPSIGANSEGSMEGIAISQNRGISLGLHMVNNTYNNFNTVFGHSNTTQHRIS